MTQQPPLLEKPAAEWRYGTYGRHELQFYDPINHKVIGRIDRHDYGWRGYIANERTAVCLGVFPTEAQAKEAVERGV